MQEQIEKTLYSGHASYAVSLADLCSKTIQSKMDQSPHTSAMTSIVIIIFSLILFICVSATNHSVGGTTGWDLVSNIQNWSSSTTFYTGDNLVFTYGPTHDVLEVNQSAYVMCQTSNPINTHNDGETVIPLDNPGMRYFICGTSGHCGSGLKLQIDVLLPPPESPTKEPEIRRKPPHSPPRSPPPPKTNVPPSPSNPETPPNESEGPTEASASEVHKCIASLLFFLPLIMTLSSCEVP